MKENAKLTNPNREVYEGMTVADFEKEVGCQLRMVMDGESWRKPCETKDELKDFLSTAQPYVKKPVPELVKYYSSLYGIK